MGQDRQVQGGGSGLRRFIRALSTASGILERLPAWALAVGAVALAVWRSGFAFTTPSLSPEISAQTFPAPTPNSEALSLGYRGIMWALDVRTWPMFHLVSLVIALAAIGLIAMLLAHSRRRRAAVLLVLLVAAGPPGAVILTNIGKADVLVIVGGVLLGLSRGRALWWLPGTLFMVAGNPEQAVIATGAYALAVAAVGRGTLPRVLPTALLALGVAFTGFIALAAYAQASGLPTRFGSLGTNLKPSLAAFLETLPLQLYSAFGFGIVLLILCALSLPPARAVLLAAGVIVLPLAATAVTLDQTRVLVCVSTAAVVVAMTVALDALDTDGGLRPWLPAAMLLAVVVAPATVVAAPGEVVVPFRQALWFVLTRSLPTT